MQRSTHHRPVGHRRAATHARRNALLGAGTLCLALVTLTGCQSTKAAEGIGFREARFQKMQSQQAYRTCVADAITLNEEARKSRTSAQYLASARLLEECERGLGPHADGSMDEERMRAYALSVQNYLKGGDIDSARTNFEALGDAFPKRDLFYPDGSSFRDSMALLLGVVDPNKIGALMTRNISHELRSELLRAKYWKRH